MLRKLITLGLLASSSNGMLRGHPPSSSTLITSGSSDTTTRRILLQMKSISDGQGGSGGKNNADGENNFERTGDATDGSEAIVILTGDEADPPLLVCPVDSVDAIPFQTQTGVRTCQTNADCDGFNNFDGPTCCLFPRCICGSPQPGASSNIKCLANPLDQEVVDRTDDASGDNAEIVTVEGGSGDNSTTDETGSSSESDSDNAAGPLRTCPTAVPNPFEGNIDLRICKTNADCLGFDNFDGPTCCLYPQCVCGTAEAGAMNVKCVSDEEEVPDRTDDGGLNNIDIPVDPEPAPEPTLAPTPQPIAPEPTPAPTPLITTSSITPAPGSGLPPRCPSNVSESYSTGDVRTCTSNADCRGFETTDGPTCCLYPNCICGNPNPGALSVQCLSPP